MITMNNFLEQTPIKITSEQVDDNPHMNSERDMNHYKVTLSTRISGKRKQYTTFFSMGLGLRGDPKVDDVLNSLALDSSGIENARSFEDWASDYGYDTDSRKAAQTYKVYQQQAAKLKKFLGKDTYNQLLFDVEPL
jgi:hypothetical protein